MVARNCEEESKTILPHVYSTEAEKKIVRKRVKIVSEESKTLLPHGTSFKRRKYF